MKRRIHISLIGKSPGWQNVLNQVGASWSVLKHTTDLDFTNSSCVIINKRLNRDESSDLEKYLHDGGAVIDANGGLSGVTPYQKKLKIIDSLNEPDKRFNHICEISLSKASKIFPNSELLSGTVHFDVKVNRCYAFIGIDPEQFFSGYKKNQTRFPHSKHPTVSERASDSSSFPFAQLILQILIILHNKSGLPFVHKWWHPHKDKQLFTFRIDTDYGTDETTEPLIALLNKYQVPATWFLDVSEQENFDTGRLSAHNGEAALHCYDHIEFREKDQIIDDIWKGLKFFQRNNLMPAGYAAPYGNWSDQLQSAIDESEFDYSSEFCYDFDSLPSFPAESSVLQIPIHPVSIGTLKRFKYSPEMMTRYFEEQIQLKAHQNQPLNLYHHPNDENLPVLEEIFKKLNSQDYQKMTYSEYSDWWKKRADSNCNFYFAPEGKIESDCELPIAIHNNGTFTVTNSNEITISDLKFVSFAGQSLTDLLIQQMNNQKLPWLTLKKYAFLSWLWRNKS